MKYRFALPKIIIVTFFLVTMTAVVSVAQDTNASVVYCGVNLAAGCFGGEHLPGTYNVEYVYPSSNDTDYFQSKGMNIIRFPFLWERLQPQLNGKLLANQLCYLRDFVTGATAKGMYVILDPHNFGKYYGSPIGTTNVPLSAFSNFWSQLASVSEFRTNNHVFFNLMNEPTEMSAETWRDAANLAIAAIRNAGATNLLLVPGNNWTGAHSWCDASQGTPNATVMLTLKDPASNYAFDVHQYFDSDSSGTSPDSVSATIGAERLKKFTEWCRANKRHGFLGEFGAATNSTSLEALRNSLAFMKTNADVWLGWTYWNAGPRVGEYMYTIEPADGVDRPQMKVLEAYLPHRGHDVQN